MDVNEPGTDTSLHLQKWNVGNEQGLEALLERHLPWLRNRVQKRMDPILRNSGDTTDFVHDTFVQFLKSGPRFTISNDAHFRGLMEKIVRNTMCKKRDWLLRKRRDIARQVRLSDTVLTFDPPRGEDKTPSGVLDQTERKAWIQFCLCLLNSEDQEILILRKWDNAPFKEMGERLGITADAVRMRYNRALGRLGSMVCALRRGELQLIINETEA